MKNKVRLSCGFVFLFVLSFLLFAVLDILEREREWEREREREERAGRELSNSKFIHTFSLKLYFKTITKKTL